MNADKPTHLDLFSGIGGFSLAFEREGFRTIGFAEIDPYASAVLRKHWPHVPNLGDARKLCRRVYDCQPGRDDGEVDCPLCGCDFGECDCIGTDHFIDEHGIPDVITGGDPCQSNSNACRAADAREASLGWEYIRIIRELQPRFVLRENPAVVRRDAPWPWQRFCLHLEALGYYTLPVKAAACCFGADHRRDRLFVLAAIQDADKERLQGFEREILAGAAGRRYYPDATRSNRWSATPRICRGIDGIPNRMDRLACLGNAIVPQVAQIFARFIYQIIATK